MALSLLSQAANGTTFHELQKALNLNPEKATVATQVHDYLELLSKNAYGSQILMANRIYVPKWFQLRKSFQDVASEKFSSGVESVDFEKSNETADAINQFVKNATDGKIGKIIKPADLYGQNGAILVNALTLKSKWSCPFSVGDTIGSFFFNNNPDRAELAGVYFMRTKGSFPTLYLRELGVKMLRLNFKNSSLAFVIAMPIVEADELHTVEERIRNYTLAKLLDHMAPGECSLKHGKLRVDIPKIKIETEINLNEVLKKILSAYLRKLGVPKSWNIVDVLGLDEELLDQVPKPAVAVILLFPLSKKYEQHRLAEDEKLKANPPVYPNDLFYMKQTINNACGTCALIHSVSNNKEIVLKDGILKKFLNSARDLKAEERGKLLEANTDFMHTMNTHPMPASEESSETSSDGVNLHFVAFIEKDGELYELDGLKSFPIKHGPTTKETFLKDAAKVCKEFMARDPDELRFTVSAVTHAKAEKMKEQCSILN
ncbi:hypothetical protein HA402_000601 [Bradysia odoriphaga]|nr:hypothetical protein HA402_000601 [Bradysia odoriphaga]